MIIAIHPDDYTDRRIGKCDASSPRWAQFIRNAGHEVRWVDVYRADVLQQLEGCSGFMWRHNHSPDMRSVSRRLLPVIEQCLGLVMYPDQRTCWHYDDKIIQGYLFDALGIPSPRTWIWFDKEAALNWVCEAPVPLVMKLWSGAGSSNVRLLKTPQQARYMIERAFEQPFAALSDFDSQSLFSRARALARYIIKGPRRRPCELHGNYVLFQEFLPGNGFDTRITVIGKRAFGFRRFNRPNDFRASGSGVFDVRPDEIDLGFVRLAFRAAQALGAQSCAIDGLYTAERRHVLAEVSYTYVSWTVHECPGHWVLDGAPDTGSLVWKDGQIWPEEAQIADYLVRLNTKQ